VVKPYVEKAQVTFPVAVDTADLLGQAFGLKAIPVSIFVDEVGIVRLRSGGPSPELFRQIEELLREPVSQVRGKVPEAATSMTKFDLEGKIALDPADWKSHIALAQAYAQEGRPEAAIAHLQTAAAIRPADSSVPFTWGLLLLQQGQKEAGLTKLKQARDLDPDNWRIRKQIWAIEHPEKFYTAESPDYAWQNEQLKNEKE
jgi:tetratricopeptide (TPR) repeat protein